MDKVEKICSNEDVAPQSREILETFVRGGGGGGCKRVPQNTKVCKFSQLCGAISSLV